MRCCACAEVGVCNQVVTNCLIFRSHRLTQHGMKRGGRNFRKIILFCLCFLISKPHLSLSLRKFAATRKKMGDKDICLFFYV